MPKEDNKKPKYNHGQKSMKVPFIIYADLESLPEKMSIFHNNPKHSSTAKIKKTHTFWLFIVYTLFIWLNKKISLIIIEVKTAWKGLVRI